MLHGRLTAHPDRRKKHRAAAVEPELNYSQ